MINKATTAIIMMLSVANVSADAEKMGEPIDWSDKHPYDEHAYFDNIPDLFNMTETRFWFTQTHWFITGVMRGLYDDNNR